MVHALFDIDETLLSVPRGLNALSSTHMFQQVFGVDANEDLIDNVGKTEQGIIKEVLNKLGKESIIPDEAYQVWAESIGKELKKRPAQVLPGIIELLTSLSKNPTVMLEFLTGNSPWRSEEKLKSAKLYNFFKDSKTGRLQGAFGNMAEKRYQLFDIIKNQATPKDHFIIIDDSILGAQLAQEHGIPIILVATGKAHKEHLAKFSSYVFQDFGDNRWQEAVHIIESV